MIELSNVQHQCIFLPPMCQFMSCLSPFCFYDIYLISLLSLTHSLFQSPFNFLLLDTLVCSIVTEGVIYFCTCFQHLIILLFYYFHRSNFLVSFSQQYRRGDLVHVSVCAAGRAIRVTTSVHSLPFELPRWP